MIHTIDTITASIYFKIYEDESKIDLLNYNKKESRVFYKIIEKIINFFKRKKKVEISVEDAWQKIVEEDNKLTNNETVNKGFNLQKKIQELDAKYNALSRALFYLSVKRDEVLEKQVLKYNYKLNEDTFNQDVATNLKLINSINMRIKKHQLELEDLFKEKENQGKKETFVNTLMSYYVFLKMPITANSNTLLLLDYRGIENQVLSQIKALQNGKG